jgi:hypothetical protein
MTFLNNHHNPTSTTVLPDFQYLTSPSDEQPISTTSHIPFNPLPKSVDVNQYGNNIANNTTHVILNYQNAIENKPIDILGYPIFTYTDEQFFRSTTNGKYWPDYDRFESKIFICLKMFFF